MPLTVKYFVVYEYEPGKWGIRCDFCDTREHGGWSEEEAARVRLVHDKFWHQGPIVLPW